MSGPHLITREEALRRAERIAQEYRALYGVEFEPERRFISLSSLVPTQAQLNEAKLIVVLQEIKHGYDAPVIVIPYGEKYYIVDGHHRAFALWKLGFGEVEAVILRPGRDFIPGIVRTAEKSGLKSLTDIKIVRD
ncbi:ParB/RepB/Spo0J family partition protein [Thermococcus sp.]|uniref:ParB/RepB/Spo0J family partition protein n=1 Tax=Thermococcus sp. TaxID=35749 RepID=UPI0026310BB2|nr:ParB/RepB/Spo0J family partition protein [Thermococcus sp.]